MTLKHSLSLVLNNHLTRTQGFRSNATLESITKAQDQRTKNLVLYNYPSFSGSFSALFAHIFHSHLNLPCLVLPFSSVEPFRLTLCLRLCVFLLHYGFSGYCVDMVP